MKKEDIDTLILSDIHFGSELCNAELLFEVMSQFRFRRLILNGDIFDHLNLEFEMKTRHIKAGQSPRVKKHRLKKSHLRALSFTAGFRSRKMIAKWFGSKAITTKGYLTYFLR